MAEIYPDPVLARQLALADLRANALEVTQAVALKLAKRVLDEQHEARQARLALDTHRHALPLIISGTLVLGAALGFLLAGVVL
jgi:hypothetical protein